MNGDFTTREMQLVRSSKHSTFVHGTSYVGMNVPGHMLFKSMNLAAASAQMLGK